MTFDPLESMRVDVHLLETLEAESWRSSTLSPANQQDECSHTSPEDYMTLTFT